MANPKCNVEESEWDERVQELRSAFETLPSIIVNSVYQPNIDSTLSPFAPKGRGESIKRNLFKSPKVQVRERAVEESESAEDREGLDVDEDRESLVDEGPSNSLSKEMINFKERLLDTASVEAKRSGARKKVVDYFKKNLDVLNHYNCLLCGYETPWRKNLYRHYNNASNCRTPALLTKITNQKGSVKPVSSRPTSKPVVSRERVAVESAEPHSNQEDKVVEREEVESAEPHSDQEGQVVDTSIIEDDTETNSILTDLNSYHQEIGLFSTD